MECKYFKGICKRKGKYKGVQKWQCNNCGKHQRKFYRQKCYAKEVEQRIVLLNNEGMGVRSIGRILHIPKSSVQLLLLKASEQIQSPVYEESGQVYEVDELYAPVRSRLCFVIYAINRATRKVIAYVTGARTKANIEKVIKKLLILTPKRIYTDKLQLFSYIIPGNLHREPGNAGSLLQIVCLEEI